MSNKKVKKVKAEINWKNYGLNSCLMPICIRSPAINGSPLEATLDAMQERINQVTVIMCDSLDRYNLGGDIETSHRNADKWLLENTVKFHERFEKVDVLRWDDIIADEQCQMRIAFLTGLYRSNQAVRAILDANVWCYVGPKLQREGYFAFDVEEEFHNSISYLIEEYAGAMTYRHWFQGQSEVYWGVYINDVDIFNKAAPNAEIDLTMTETLPVTVNRLGASRAGETTALYQRDVRALLQGYQKITA